MHKIVKKQRLNENTVLMEIEAPLVAAKVKAGQFIMLRIDEHGERIPLTVADHDAARRTVTIIFQEVGATTMRLGELNEGDCLRDVVGPLGRPSELEGIKRAAVIGGGLGCAIAYPQAKALHEAGAKVDIIAGFRNVGIVILEDEMRAVCDNLYITTDDGSNGNKGFVTDELKKHIEEGADYDAVIAIGPLPMMKFVSKLTKEYGIKTIVSMNTVMIDGTGMCGGCRVTVGGEVKFACVDGPDFDGHLVDFDEAMRRNGFYKAEEKAAVEAHKCRLGMGGK